MLRLALLCVCVCVLAGPGAADWEAAQARFRAAYRPDIGAKQRREALRELASADVPEAAALLVELYEKLDRDAAARRKKLLRLRAQARKLRDKVRAAPPRKQNAWKERLARVTDDEDAENGALAAIELEQVAILDGLEAMRDAKVVDWCAAEGLRAARAPVLLRVLAAKVAAFPGAGAARLVVALDQARRPDQIIPLLQALGVQSAHAPEGAWKSALPVLLRHLGHRDWAVRVAAGYALARAGQPEGVGPLVAAIGKEAADSRARREMGRSLTILTGRRFGADADLWARWWVANEAKVRRGEVPLGKGELASAEDKAEQGRFYGIPQVASRIVYVLDVSGSMEVSMTHPRWVDGGPVAARDDEDSRFDAAVRELLRATRRLRRGTEFAVVLYHSHAVPLHTALVPATKDNLARLETALARTGPIGSTNIYEALDHALRLANVHPDATGPSRADAIYLISDGSPTDAKGNAEDPDRVLAAARSWNAHRRVAIHAIGIGAQHNAAFLQTLARENGGTYRAVVPPKKKR